MRYFTFRLLVLASLLLLATACSKPAQEAEQPAAATAPAEAAAPAEGAAAEAPAAEAPAAEAPAAPAPVADTGDPVTAAAASNLHGTWDLDTAALLAAINADESLPPEARMMLAAMLGEMRLSIAFSADGSVTIEGEAEGQPQTTAGTWESVGAEGNTLRVRMTVEQEGETESQEMVATFRTTEVMEFGPATEDGAPSSPMERMTLRRRS